MYSKKLKTMIDLMEKEVTVEQRADLAILQKQLTEDAPVQACLRCAEADFFIRRWQANGGKGWRADFARCGKFMELQKAEDGSLVLPCVQFCTAMTTEDLK